MSDILLTALSALIQTFMTFYFTLFLTQSLENEKYTKTSKLYCLLLQALGIFCSTFLPIDSGIFNILSCSLTTFISLKFVLKANLMKATFITIGTFILFAITELLSTLILSNIFNCDMFDIKNNISLFITFSIIQNIMLLLIIKFIMYTIIKTTNFSEIAENMNSDQLFNIIFIFCICILPKVLIRGLNNYEYSTLFLIISAIETIVMIILTFIFFKRTLERDKAQSELFISEMHNKTMIGMVDGVKTLKHDYNNIIQALSGYVSTKQYDKLQEHINKVLQECNVVNNLSIITPELFNEPAIYGIMGAKYFLAADKDIKVDLDITCDFTKISFPMPELSRILGIILDNAMEATEKSNNKYIRFEARYDSRKNADILKIINTYDTSINIDLEKIYEKGVSSKKVKSGIGLWEVKKLIKKNKNSQIYPTIENGKFAQNIVIERLSEINELKKTNTEISENKNEEKRQIMLIPIKNKR